MKPIKKLVEIFSQVHPPWNAENVALGETVTIPANSTATITFGVEQNFEAFIKSVSCDRLTDLQYTWTIGGFQLNISEFEFEKAESLGKSANETTAMTLEVKNTTGQEKDVDIAISGWGIRR